MLVNGSSAALRVGLLFVLVASICVSAQESKPTVRHHRVEETVPDDTTSPEVDQAEAAMQKNDFAAAASLLQKAVAVCPTSFAVFE